MHTPGSSSETSTNRRKLTFRPGNPSDAAACAVIGVQTLASTNDRHGLPRDFAAPEPTARMIAHALTADWERSSIGLVRAALRGASMTFCTKLGFEVREPPVWMRRRLWRSITLGVEVRKMAATDVNACDDVCRLVHGHDRGGDRPAPLGEAPARASRSPSATVRRFAGASRAGCEWFSR